MLEKFIKSTEVAIQDAALLRQELHQLRTANEYQEGKNMTWAFIQDGGSLTGSEDRKKNWLRGKPHKSHHQGRGGQDGAEIAIKKAITGWKVQLNCNRFNKSNMLQYGVYLARLVVICIKNSCRCRLAGQLGVRLRYVSHFKAIKIYCIQQSYCSPKWHLNLLWPSLLHHAGQHNLDDFLYGLSFSLCNPFITSQTASTLNKGLYELLILLPMLIWCVRMMYLLL